MTYYRIVYDLETKYRTLQEAIHANYKGTWLLPTIPATTMSGEDTTTERICAARTIEDCITAIRVYGPFKRCLAANEDAKSYREVMDEAYPIIVQELEPNEIPTIPTEDQVPDVKYTNERWFLNPVRIKDSYVRWLDSDSILFEESATVGGSTFGICTGVTFVEDYRDKDHPWLNGRGHILSSSCMDTEYETFPVNLEPAVNRTTRYLVEIKDSFRIRIPDELVRKFHYEPGCEINFRQVDRAGGSETLWSEFMDRRQQVAIPEEIVKAFGLRDCSTLMVYEGTARQLCLADAVRWSDETVDVLDDRCDALCRIRTELFDVMITKRKAVDGLWIYNARLSTPDKGKRPVRWDSIIHIYEDGKTPKPTLMLLQQLALEQLSRTASDLLCKAENDCAAYKGIAEALRNLA